MGANTGASAIRSNEGQFPASAGARINVAHDGAGEHDAAGAPDRLKRTGDNQHFDRARERASQARHAIKRNRSQQHGLAAVSIRHRAIENLSHRETNQIGGNRKLHLGR